jgi:hypothetical protein
VWLFLHPVWLFHPPSVIVPPTQCDCSTHPVWLFHSPSVIVPPIPRYLFACCCNDAGHCTNASNADYAETLLAGFLRLRNELIRTLVAAGIKNFKVLDSCCTTACTTTANTKNRLTHLKSVTAKDGIHYVAAGYQHLAARSLSCLRTILSESMRQTKPTAHFWRGFKSIRGSKRALIARHSRERGEGGSFSHRARGFHPYFRYWTRKHLRNLGDVSAKILGISMFTVILFV